MAITEEAIARAELIAKQLASPGGNDPNNHVTFLAKVFLHVLIERKLSRPIYQDLSEVDLSDEEK